METEATAVNAETLATHISTERFQFKNWEDGSVTIAVMNAVGGTYFEERVPRDKWNELVLQMNYPTAGNPLITITETVPAVELTEEVPAETEVTPIS